MNKEDDKLDMETYLMNSINRLSARIRSLEEVNNILVSENNKLYTELVNQKTEFKKLKDIVGEIKGNKHE